MCLGERPLYLNLPVIVLRAAIQHPVSRITSFCRAITSSLSKLAGHYIASGAGFFYKGETCFFESMDESHKPVAW